MSKQEPVAWRVYYEVTDHYIIFQQFPNGLKRLDNKHNIQPLYTAPPKRKPLSDEEIKAIGNSINKYETLENGRLIFARAIEKAHGIGVGND